MGWELPRRTTARVNAEGVLAAVAERCPFSLDPEFAPDSDSEALLQSPAEAWFLEKWVPRTLGSSAAHWFTPQASLDTLLEAGGLDGPGARRIDFLFHHPGGRPVGIEIDGEEHVSATAVDDARDRSLAQIGIDVLRITHHEILQGDGVALDRLQSKCRTSLESLTCSEVDRRIARFLLDCSNAAKIQFAIVRAIGWGWLNAGQQWDIELAGAGLSAAAGVLDVLQLISGFDVLYGDVSAPERCTLRGDDGSVVAWGIGNDGSWQETNPSESQGDSVRLVVESHTSPYHRLDANPHPDLILRPAFLPVEFAAEIFSGPGRQPIAPRTYEQARPALTNFLHAVFRKCQFRPMQGEAVYSILRQKDCVVLLPTGAGKSLIYQLAGLLMPGVTVVVDPIVALIEDQVEGLQAYGIDRATPITRHLSSPEGFGPLFRRVERGEYHFVLLSPERLQTPGFRNALRALAEVSLVNLAVIDEAHCVSEWGHDFRPAYLNLGNNLRRFGTAGTGSPPPILALTGTASRAVLRDMLIDLGIDRDRSDAVIRPDSFNRSELHFEVVRIAPPQDPRAALRGVLNSMPAKFGLPRAELYRPSGRHTASGIVFVPTINARDYGLFGVRRTVQGATDTPVVCYAGGSPRGVDRSVWDGEKRRNAHDFKRNRVPILVATKAFGMGIDKPNVRYTIHFGMPGSLESFYQEAGRAGRDRKPARCVIVFSEYDEGRSDDLLDPDRSFAELRDRAEAVSDARTTGDDVTRALWFHLQGFSGTDDEIDDIQSRLEEIGSLSSRRVVHLSSGKDDEKRAKERALYRLLRIGVISDYEVDFGANKFIVTADAFDFESCKKRLLDYVHAAQPARSMLIARQLNSIVPANPHYAAYELAKVFIRFIYDVIERSRRRMIQESVLLARRADSDEEVRTRLLDYLQEGGTWRRAHQSARRAAADFPAKLVRAGRQVPDAGRCWRTSGTLHPRAGDIP